MPAETLTPPDSPALPQAELAAPLPTPPEAAPYYAMSKEQIEAEIDKARANVGAALVEAERRKAAALESGEAKPAPLFLILEGDDVRHHQEGQIQDPEKARVMAEAEVPYRERGARLWRRAKRVHDTIVGPTSLVSVARQPLRLARFVSKGLKAEHALQRGWNAAIIAGVNFERMLEASMPYVPKIDVSDTVGKFLGTAEKQPAPTSPPTETLVNNLQLDAQLAEQLQILSHNGLLQQLSNGEIGIVDDEGHEYPAPTAATIRQLVERHQELIKIKADQGFTRLLLIPQAASATQLAESYRRELAARYQAGQLHDAYGKAVRLDSRLLAAPGEAELFGPGHLDDTKDKPSRARHLPGWRVVLVKNMPEIPHRAQEVVYFGGRGEFVATLRAAGQGLKDLARIPALHGEQGFTAGAWLAYASSELARTGTVVDFYSGTLLLGSESPGLLRKGRHTPWVGWGNKYRHSDLRDLNLGETTKRIRVDNMGIRTLVDIS